MPPDLDEVIARNIDAAKRSCALCRGRSRLRNVDRERNNARNAASNLVQLFNEKFNQLRKQDADAAEIKKAIECKRQCMNALQQCDRCDKEVDFIKRKMNELG